MKKLFLNALMVVALSCAANAQEKEQANFANWVVETNVKTPRQAIVKFYNEKQEVIYQENIVGKKIKFAKPKVQKALNELLTQLLAKQYQVTDTNLVLATAKNW